MQFEFPASDEEKKLIYELTDEIKQSIAHSINLTEQLKITLNENYLAIDSKYRDELNRSLYPFYQLFWDINVQLIKLQNQKSRIISSNNEN